MRAGIICSKFAARAAWPESVSISWISPALTIAAGNTPNSQFVIDLTTLDAANQPGLAANFNPSQPYSFVLATAAGGITGFSADEFRIDTRNFANELASGNFHVAQSGNDLVLNFNPAPLLGDYNQDGAVDTADYVVWRKIDGTQSGYDFWRTNYGRATTVGSLSDVTVPEPATCLLFTFGAALGCCCSSTKALSMLNSLRTVLGKSGSVH